MEFRHARRRRSEPRTVSPQDRAAAIAATDPWDGYAITDAQTTPLTPDSAVLTYRWRSRRVGDVYAAVMSSVYARRDGGWRLVLHQQTPEPG